MILDFIKLVNGIAYRCPRTPVVEPSVHYGAGGRVGAPASPAKRGERATPFLAAHFAKRNTKFGGGGTLVVERFAFTTGQEARAGPEGETSFPYEVNKNSCFLLAP